MKDILGLIAMAVLWFAAGYNVANSLKPCKEFTSKAEAIEIYQAEHGQPLYGEPLGTLEPIRPERKNHGQKQNQTMPPLRFIEWFRNNGS